MIEIKDLTFAYKKGQRVIDGLTLEVPSGSICGMFGPNGSGKSTLLYLISGLLTPDGGTVKVDGQIPRRREPSFLSKVFIVPEEFDLPRISMREFIDLNAPFYPNFSEKDLKRHLETFEMDANLQLGALSMGQKKKAYMCFALACNTKLLLLDEPTNGLDLTSKSSFRRFIVSTMSEDRTILISTHQVKDIDTVIDRVMITNGKTMTVNDSVENLLNRYAFVNTNDSEVIARALASQPTPNGVDVVIENDGTMETRLNLELLYALYNGKSN